MIYVVEFFLHELDDALKSFQKRLLLYERNVIYLTTYIAKLLDFNTFRNLERLPARPKRVPLAIYVYFRAEGRRGRRDIDIEFRYFARIKWRHYKIAFLREGRDISPPAREVLERVQAFVTRDSASPARRPRFALYPAFLGAPRVSSSNATTLSVPP